LVPLAVSTFGEIAALGLEAPVWCQRCKQQRPVPLSSPALHVRSFAGSRFRCTRILWDGKVCNGPAIQPFDWRRCCPPIRIPASPTSTGIDACCHGAPCRQAPAAGGGEATGLAAEL